MAEQAFVGIAEDIARRAHAGQVDKAGLDYITHPARVAAGEPMPEAQGQPTKLVD